MDKGKTGFVKLDVIFKKIHMKRNIMTDCILELLSIEMSGKSISLTFIKFHTRWRNKFF